MAENLSIRINAEMKKRLDDLSKQSKRSKSFLAGQAIRDYVESEEWQVREIEAAIAEVESGQGVSHGKVAGWLKSWGKGEETEVPG